MPPSRGDYVQPSPFPRPGPVVFTLLCVFSGVWLAFAVGMNWAGVSLDAFRLFCGSTIGLWHGQLWRIFTSPLLHAPNRFWHLGFALLELYFFGVQLERDWGRARFIRFLFWLALFQAVAQVLADVFVPATVSRYLSDEYWYGSTAIMNGLVIAAACSYPNSTIRIYGIIPVSPRVIALLCAATPFFYLLFKERPPEGFAALLAGSAGGWLLGAGTPSPLRRSWLKFRLGRLDAEVAREAAQRKKRVERSQLKVIEGGRSKNDGGSDGGRGPDGRWLN